MKFNAIWILLLSILTLCTKANATVVQAIRDLLQYNLAGIPLTHEVFEIEFDPEVSRKRRELYEELNGFRGAKLIERLGAGIDGNHKERLAYQRLRDDGHLGGLNYFSP